VDTTPPSSISSVNDGTGTDIAFTSSKTQLSANWAASSDAQSGIAKYQYAIGTTVGGLDVVAWTDTTGTSVTKTGLSLTNGTTYYVKVRAINGAGASSSSTSSNGQKVDTTPPSSISSVNDGTGADIATTSSKTQLSANWTTSSDTQSGIAKYQYAIGTIVGGLDVVAWTDTTGTSVTKTGLSLTNGTTYYVKVRAINGAGASSSSTSSNGQKVVAATAVASNAESALPAGEETKETKVLFAGGWRLVAIPAGRAKTGSALTLTGIDGVRCVIGPAGAEGECGESIYWAFFAKETMIEIAAGIEAPGESRVELVPGWNAIGLPFGAAGPLDWASATLDGRSFAETGLKLYRWDGEGYATADALKPWVGYLVFVETAGVLEISAK
jgi:hypothetical protein